MSQNDPHSLLVRLPDPVADRIRAIGRDVEIDVEIVEAGPTLTRAIIVPATTRWVVLELVGETLECRCDCVRDPPPVPMLCEHIAATILTVERLRSMRPMTDTLEVHLLNENSRQLTEEPTDDGDAPVSEFGEWLASLLPLGQPARTTHGKRRRATEPSARSVAEPERWQHQLREIQLRLQPVDRPRLSEERSRQLLYVVDLASSNRSGEILIEVLCRDQLLNGAWGSVKQSSVTLAEIPRLPDPLDRQLMSMLQAPSIVPSAALRDAAQGLRAVRHAALLPLACSTGRASLRSRDKLNDLTWDDGPPWQLHLVIERDGAEFVGRAAFYRDGERIDLSQTDLVVPGLVFAKGRVARTTDDQTFPWLEVLRRDGEIRIPVNRGDILLAELYRVARRPPLVLPTELGVVEIGPSPQPRLHLLSLETARKRDVGGELSFDYDNTIISWQDPEMSKLDAERMRVVRRSPELEAAAVARLRTLGAVSASASYRRFGNIDLRVSAKRVPELVRSLVADGWHVEGDGRLFRTPGPMSIRVSSDVDWFNLTGNVTYGDQVATLPDILAAARRGQTTVVLGDGTVGVLPEKWLQQHGFLLDLGKVVKKGIRFRRSQLLLIDALLAAQSTASADEVLTRAREELAAFAGIAPADPSTSFKGDLRQYQREGLAWLLFLRQFGFGGCLADDMGLGKTVQVLALLATVGDEAGHAPTLVVVPRSLLFHWRMEAKRFAPKLRVLVHIGGSRGRLDSAVLANHDLIVTTYGTLRRDIADVKDLEFEYCVLDEAQMIKNARSQTAKSVRLIRARHRLALSGTPVENHIGEIWSLFEFLNPGMLGTASAFRGAFGSTTPDKESRRQLGQALKPFLLRRTKSKVANDLPEKLEQTLACELGPAQRQMYDELLGYYRQSLLARVDENGLERSKMHVLEALLRLRQAACHPGLIDKKRTTDSSAKLDILLSHLGQIVDEGHKALVFSQFTQFLDIVRRELDRLGITYEYLDGSTTDRARRVERFQNRADCPLFLISLKAGGLGLNLTAADYVYLLDPWWNPAVEAQAIDRAHRIGQARRVFAYRLIAHNTIEEKVLVLQSKKRDLADAIIAADSSLIKDLRREDLELLLS